MYNKLEMMMLTPHWVFELENKLSGSTGSNYPTGSLPNTYSLSRMQKELETSPPEDSSLVGLYLPERKGIEDLVQEWKNASIMANTWVSEGEGEIYRETDYFEILHALGNEFNRRGHIDLAHQAISMANLMELRWSSMPDSIFHQIKMNVRRANSRIDKPVYFVLDFDHTLARTNVAHENLLKAAYAALPEDIRGRMPYQEFSDKFEEVYTSHQKKAGMHKPNILIQDLIGSWGIEEIPKGIFDIYDAYYNAFLGNMFKGTALVLQRWCYLGKSVILTFGDRNLQQTSVERSGVLDFVDDVRITEKKSPEAVSDALQTVGYKGKGYIIGIGDKPSDAVAIKEFEPRAISVRIRHPNGKYSALEPRSPVEVSDFEYSSLLDLDSNLHLIFQAMMR